MRKRSLNFKVIGIVIVMSLGCLAILGVGFWGVSKINKILNHATTTTAVRTHLDHTLKGLYLVQEINLNNYLTSTTPEQRQHIKDMYYARDKQITETIEARKKVAGPAGLRDLATFQKHYDEWKALNKTLSVLIDEGKREEAFALVNERGAEHRQAITKITDDMVGSNFEDMTADRSDAEKTDKEARLLMVITSVVSMLFGIILSIVVLRAMSRAINQVIHDLSSNSQQVTQAAEQIATTSSHLAEASTEQAASLEETVATLEELSSMIKMNSDNANQAAKLSDQTESVAKKGDNEIKNLINSMTTITNDSRKIEEIITVIDDIAFQTNLLALNASVEAARAGEQGRGFAIVADAVRGLAQRSATAAKEITDLIKGSVAAIESGSKEVKNSADTLKEIVNYSQKVKDINREIATASEEQARGIEQIGKAMNQLDQAVQVNAASSEEASAAAQELSAQAGQLDETVGVLQVTIKGGVQS